MLDPNENGLELNTIGEAIEESPLTAAIFAVQHAIPVKVHAPKRDALNREDSRGMLLADCRRHGLASLWCGGLELGGLVRA